MHALKVINENGCFAHQPSVGPNDKRVKLTVASNSSRISV